MESIRYILDHVWGWVGSGLGVQTLVRKDGKERSMRGIDIWKEQHKQALLAYGKGDYQGMTYPVTPVDYASKMFRYWDSLLAKPEFAEKMRGIDDEVARNVNDRIIKYNQLRELLVKPDYSPKESGKKLEGEEAIWFWRIVGDMVGGLDIIAVTPTKWEMITESVQEAAKEVAETGFKYSKQILIGLGILVGGYILYKIFLDKPKVVVQQVRNPPPMLTHKGERMYKTIRDELLSRHSPRAKEIAARTVYSRAANGWDGLIHPKAH